MCEHHTQSIYIYNSFKSVELSAGSVLANTRDSVTQKEKNQGTRLPGFRDASEECRAKEKPGRISPSSCQFQATRHSEFCTNSVLKVHNTRSNYIGCFNQDKQQLEQNLLRFSASRASRCSFFNLCCFEDQLSVSGATLGTWGACFGAAFGATGVCGTCRTCPASWCGLVTGTGAGAGGGLGEATGGGASGGASG